MSEAKRKDLLIWVDLETTGLDVADQMQGVHKHKILEVGMHITDSKLNIIDKGFEIIINHKKEDLEAVMNDFVKDMHTKSGLLDKVYNSSFPLAVAEKMMVAYIESFNIEPKSSPICGNNVSFDKNFLDAQMPEFAKLLHYRKMDVSSFKEFVTREYPEVGDMVQKQMKHRGLEDIKESIDELKLYKQYVFIPTNEVQQELKSNKKIKPSV